MPDSTITALTAATSLDGTEAVPIVQSGVNKKAAVALFDVALRAVCASDATNSSTTPAAVTDLSISLAPGVYNIKVWMLLTSAATSTGIGVHLNASGGTVTHIAATWYSLTTGTTATSGTMDQASVSATFQTMEGRAQRANNTSGGTFGGVDTANADQFAVLEGIVVVTATTTLQVMLASEVASSAVKMLTGSNIRAVQVA